LVRGSVSWELSTASIVAGAATITVLALLWRLRLEDAAMRRALTRINAQSQHQQAQIDQHIAEDSKRTAKLGRQATTITELSAQASSLRESEQQLHVECGLLREGNRVLHTQAEAIQRAVRQAFGERIPAALAGIPVPAAETEGIDAELAKLLDEGVSGSAALGDQQDSMRSAVVALARRVQASAHRIQEEANLMADRHPGDGDVLEVSMRVDHAAAQQARHAQSMAVLCGEWPGQQWPEPLPFVDVVRAAAGRIIAYRRIEVAGDQEVAASAPIVEPLIHLVAELLSNATQSSPPATMVPVTVRTVQRGAVIEVHDCGVGLDDYRLTQAREIASGSQVIGLDDLGEFPQTGLAVVGQYVRRHGLRVDISESVYGGVRAVVGVPAGLIETVAPADAVAAPADPAVESAGSTAGTPVSAARDDEGDGGEGEDGEDGTGSADAFRRGLPRRHSPRHENEEPASPVSPDESAPAPTPEEAGAWMGAFLNGSEGSAQEDPAQEDPAQEAMPQRRRKTTKQRER
jgi:signal transduction histidine kinase